MGVSRRLWFVVASMAARARSRSQRGASAVEYGLMLALIAVAIAGALSFLGTEASKTFSCSSDQIGDPSAAPC